MRQMDDDQFSAMLKDRADEVVGDIQLDHPGMSEELPIPGFSPEDAPSPSTRRTWWLGMAAALLLVVAGGVYLMVGGDDSLPVTTPADGEPDAADLGPIPDPATSSPEEVVRAAIERTSAVSWTAEQTATGEVPAAKIQYNPAENGDGHWRAMVSTDGEFRIPRPERTESDQPRVVHSGDGLSLGECLNEAPPCSYGKWYTYSRSTTESEIFPLFESLDPASAEERGDGVYAVLDMMSSESITLSIVHIEDGFVRRITWTSEHEITITSLGDAPKVALPQESDIVDPTPDGSEFTEEMAAAGEFPECTVFVRLSSDSAAAATPSGMSIENEILLQVSSQRDEAATVDELLQWARDTDFVDEVTAPARADCDTDELHIVLEGPGGTVSTGPVMSGP